ncbi:MAG TPA: hypothetical protein VFW03_06765 [Gemmatimonadaceae bacterium]|nr:hypothetical protein [Gemmatimonadaceae bacterium]
MAASALTSGACYRYTPIDSPAPALGSEVRLRLTDAGAITMAPLVGNRIEVVDGHVSSVADTSVTLSVTQTTDRLGSEVPWKGEQVVFPRTTVAGFERRSLDKGKSYLMGGITAGLVAAVGIGFSISGGGSGGQSSGTGTPK